MDFSPRYRNLVELFYGSAKEFADRPLLGRKVDGKWQWLTYSACSALVDRCRAGLEKIGVGPGDSIAVISDNRREWAIAAYATYSLGAIYVPIFQTQLEREWKYVLQDSGAKVCFVADTGIETKIKRLQGDLLSLEKIINFEGKSDDQNSFEALLRRDGQPIKAPRIPNENDVASCLYTADAKGDPVGVMLTHLNVASKSWAMARSGYGGLCDGDRSLSFLPWAQVLGGSNELNALIALGGSIAICESPDKLFEYLPEVQPTVLFSVPRVWENIFTETREQIAAEKPFMQAIFNAAMNARAKQSRSEPLRWRDAAALTLSKKLFSSAIRERLGGRLRFANSGGAALSIKCAAFLGNLDITIYDGYGLTECTGCATASGPAAYRAGSVGRPVPGTWIKIDKEVPSRNEDEGEIIICGMSVMKGYHNRPEMTRAALTEEGGLRTGDLGRLDQDGFLYITGTIKELYKLANGRYVAPASLENKLRRSTYIAQCFVYGANQPHNVALVVPDLVSLTSWAKSRGLSPFVEALLKDPRTRQLLEDEIEQCSKDFKSYERIRAFSILDKSFNGADGTLRPNLQLDRKNIIAVYQDRLDALYR